MTDLEAFDRLLKTVAAHFARYGAQGRAAPMSRSVESAFENYKEFSDAMSATLLRRAEKNANLRAGLEAWKVYESAVWMESRDMHAHRSLAEIRQTVVRDWTPKETFRAELTPEGEQTVIPGCERNAAPGIRQLELFG